MPIVNYKSLKIFSELGMHNHGDAKMLLLEELPVAKKKSPADSKSHDWKQRKEKIQSHAMYKDLAGWITDIAKHHSREAGQTVSAAMIIDIAMRDWAWRRLKKIRNAEAGTPQAEIPPAPPPPEPIPSLGSPRP